MFEFIQYQRKKNDESNDELETLDKQIVVEFLFGKTFTRNFVWPDNNDITYLT